MAVVDAFTALSVAAMDLVALPFRPEISIPASLITRSDQPVPLLAAEFATIVERTMAEISAVPDEAGPDEPGPDAAPPDPDTSGPITPDPGPPDP